MLVLVLLWSRYQNYISLGFVRGSLGYIRGGGVTLRAAVVDVVAWYVREVEPGGVRLGDLDDLKLNEVELLDGLDDAELGEIELDYVLERSFSSKITEKGLQVSGSIIGGSSGSVE